METYKGLRPMIYRLWLPHYVTYVREDQRNNRQIIHTLNRAEALQLPEPQALAKARELIRETGETIELRPVERAECQV